MMRTRFLKRKIVLVLSFVLLFPKLAYGETTLNPIWQKTISERIWTIEASTNYFIVGTREGPIYAFSYSGDLLWKNSNIKGMPYYIAVSPNGNLIAVGAIQFYNSDEGKYDHALLYLLNKNGNILWSLDPEEDKDTQRIRGNVLISEDNQYILFGIWNEKSWASDHHRVYLVDISGNIIWYYGIGNDIYDIQATSDFSYILVGSKSGAYLLNKSGKKIWDTSSSSNLDIYPVYEVGIDEAYGVAILGTGSHIYFLSLNDGEVLKKYSTGSTPVAIKVSKSGRYIAVGLYGGDILVFNYFGEFLWSYSTGGQADDIVISPDDTLIYVYGNNGVVYAFEMGTGDIKWKYSTTEVGTSIALKSDGSYLVAGGDSTLFVFRPKAAYITINSNPSGADVYLDGTKIGRTPLENYTVEAGSHVIKISKEDYEEYKEKITLDIGETRTVFATLTPKFGYLKVDSTPTGAKVYIDGTPRGSTPLTLKLDVGSYTLKLEKDGYEVVQETINIRPGETTTIIKNLIPLPVPVTINSNPSGAIVYVNGEQKGTTPLTLSLLPGTYSIKLIKNGYQEYTTQITIKVGQPVTINPTLSRISASSSPSASTITSSSTPQPQKSISSSSTVKVSNPNQAIAPGVENEKIVLVGLGIIALIGLLVVTSKKKKPKRDKRLTTKTKELFPSELLKKYEPLDFIGEGGFAKVFKVKRKSDGKIVAVKIPRIDERTSKTFLREVGTWLHLDHPNIVKLYDVDILPIPHLEMEYVEGINLNGKTIRSLEEYPKPVDEELALRLIKGITQAVEYAHSKNVLHRDIKPLNILLKHDLTPKLTDWGLSKIGITTSSKTTTGYTPLYAAPEQLLPTQYGHTDHRTDLYQLGAVFYELLTGQPPYEGHSPAELIGKITDPNYLPKKPSEFNPELYIFDSFFEKVLAKRREDRFQSAHEMLQTLEELERFVKKRKELKETVTELKKALTKSQLELKKSKSTEEAKLKTLEILDLYQKLAMLYCELNSKSELLELLESLKYHAKEENLRKDIETAEKYLRYYFEENIPIGKDFAQKLNELISHIKAEVKGDGL